ncbi:hypothetical protein [Rosenbergiella nectarea]|uniref:hypothetical protein n=1 Tax=Rosenbergiella nectarea TaxID=988801 RepID=UPI001F4D7AD7|nr:hypothetical protein [Rosenbergiella nectarea]
MLVTFCGILLRFKAGGFLSVFSKVILPEVLIGEHLSMDYTSLRVSAGFFLAEKPVIL